MTHALILLWLCCLFSTLTPDMTLTHCTNCTVPPCPPFLVFHKLILTWQPGKCRQLLSCGLHEHDYYWERVTINRKVPDIASSSLFAVAVTPRDLRCLCKSVHSSAWPPCPHSRLCLWPLRLPAPLPDMRLTRLPRPLNNISLFNFLPHLIEQQEQHICKQYKYSNLSFCH